MTITHGPDYFYKEAIRRRYAARSAFKLLEIQQRYKVIKQGGCVLDLGCAPGAWLQVACQNLGPEEKGGTVVGVDIENVKVPADHTDRRVKAIAADVMTLNPRTLARLVPMERGYSTILSDMCHSVSGIHSRDVLLSSELGSRVLELALGVHPQGKRQEGNVGLLRPEGSVVIKLLEGVESQEFPKFCKEHFRTVAWLRPKATRPVSREIYLIAKQRFNCPKSV